MRVNAVFVNPEEVALNAMESLVESGITDIKTLKTLYPKAWRRNFGASKLHELNHYRLEVDRHIWLLEQGVAEESEVFQRVLIARTYPDEFCCQLVGDLARGLPIDLARRRAKKQLKRYMERHPEMREFSEGAAPIQLGD